MKSYSQLVKCIRESRFDSFKTFKYKPNPNQPDGEYDLRAVVRYHVVLPKTGEKRVVTALFPPIQLRTTNNKYEFNRQLNAYVADLKSNGYDIIGIHLEGDPIHTKMTKGIKSR